MIGSSIGQLAIVRQIGEGGMGAVYLAEHRVLKTQHVVKVLLPQWTQNPMVVTRFVDEARAAATIRHRNVVRVENCDQLPDGQWYIVMEYLEGGTLAGFASSHGGPLGPHLILPIVAQTANGLAAAHARGIVHRDLKPENIFLTQQDGNPHFVKILDFGIAKLGEKEGDPTTRTGQMAGTPAYMAPEQMRDLKSVDPRTDVYALGVITYQLATGGWLPYQEGERPSTFYEISAAEIYHRQLTQAPIDPRKRFAGVPEGWANAILAALHPDPARRPQDMRAFALLLAEATPGDHFSPHGVEAVRACAPELLEIGNLLETVRAPKPSGGARPTSRYQFGQRLGTGGMAEVYRGTMSGAEGFSREVAIKRVLPGFSTTPQFGSMFIDEARIASQLVHPNIVQVLDFDRDPDGRLFLVMELVEGKDLDTLRETAPLPPSVIIFVISEVLRGLGYAHELPVPKDGIRGVVHRDVSPHNLLLSFEGAVKVSDFGIAKAREASAATASTMVKGKPAYMSPEQANGQVLDGRSDLFAVGVMLWELLAGQPLFVGTTQEAIAQVFFRPIPRPSTMRPGVPADLEAIAMRLLEREPSARYANAELAIDDLSRCRDAPRNGRSELVRVLAERFPDAIAARASGANIDRPKMPSAAAPTANALPPSISAGAWAPAATTLTGAASQSVARQQRRSRGVVLVGAIGAAVAVGGIAFIVYRSQTRESSARPADPPTTQAIDAQIAIAAKDAATESLHITITTEPPGANVTVDRESRGASPITLALPRGSRLAVAANREGFAEAATTVTVDHDAQTVLLTLHAKPASPPPDAATPAKTPTIGSKPSTSKKPEAPTKPHKPGFDPNDPGGDE